MVRVIANRRDRDWNTCGQAAVATLLARFGAGPFTSGAAPDDGAAIDAVSARFGPDVPFGLGTSAGRIAAALRAHGLHAEIVHSGPFGAHPERALERVRQHVSLGIPVPACVDQGLLGGPAWSAHWALVLGFEADEVVLGNTRPGRLALARFMAAWRCRQLPPPYHHCAVLASPDPLVLKQARFHTGTRAC